MVSYLLDEPLEFEEYLDFLKRCDLGSQYPKKNFEPRVRTLLRNLDIRITARNEDGLLIGVCFGLTDFVYFLFLTDLGVDRSYVKQGIGRELVRRTVERAGGPADITVTTISNEKALDFYQACDMKPDDSLVVRYCDDWESFTVE